MLACLGVVSALYYLVGSEGPTKVPAFVLSRRADPPRRMRRRRTGFESLYHVLRSEWSLFTDVRRAQLAKSGEELVCLSQLVEAAVAREGIALQTFIAPNRLIWV